MDRYGLLRSFWLALFGVLGEWTAGEDADVSVSCVASELESDWDLFQKESRRSGQQDVRCGLIASCCGTQLGKHI